MQFSFSNGQQKKAPRVLIYGVEGIGKSTFASKFPDPLFIDTEGSTAYMDVNRFDPAPTSWQNLLDMVEWVKQNGTPGSSIVIDTLDWAERLCIDATCKENNWKSIETPGYGSGYKYVYEKFVKLLDELTEVADRGINVVCTAHSTIVKFEQPDEASPYDRWGLKLIDTRKTSIANICKEWADAVFFANYKPIVERVENGGKSSAKARGNKRVMFTTHDATYDAKNRWGLPPEVPFDFSSIAAFIPTPSTYAPGATVAGSASPQSVVNVAPVSQPTNVVATPQAQPKPLQVSTGPAPALGQLHSLMASSGISEGELKAAVASQGYVTLQMPLENYPENLVAYLVAQFDAVRGVVEQQRQEVPFR